jgi:hypothetical protein
MPSKYITAPPREKEGENQSQTMAFGSWKMGRSTVAVADNSVR